MDDETVILIAGIVVLLMLCVWLFIAPFQSDEPRSPEDDADDQTFTM